MTDRADGMSFSEMATDRDSWRRVAERLEAEKQQAERECSEWREFLGDEADKFLRRAIAAKKKLAGIATDEHIALLDDAAERIDGSEIGPDWRQLCRDLNTLALLLHEAKP